MLGMHSHEYDNKFFSILAIEYGATLLAACEL